jgi:hypothetical protein
MGKSVSTATTPEAQANSVALIPQANYTDWATDDEI